MFYEKHPISRNRLVPPTLLLILIAAILTTQIACWASGENTQSTPPTTVAIPDLNSDSGGMLPRNTNLPNPTKTLQPTAIPAPPRKPQPTPTATAETVLDARNNQMVVATVTPKAGETDNVTSSLEIAVDNPTLPEEALQYNTEIKIGEVPMSVIIDVSVDGKQVAIRSGGEKNVPGQVSIAELTLAAIAGQLNITSAELLDLATNGPISIRFPVSKGVRGDRTQLELAEKQFDPRLPILIVGAESVDPSQVMEKANALGGNFALSDITLVINGKSKEGVVEWYGWGISAEGQLCIVVNEPAVSNSYINSGGYVGPWRSIALALVSLEYTAHLTDLGFQDTLETPTSQRLVVILRMLASIGIFTAENEELLEQVGIQPQRTIYWQALGAYIDGNQGNSFFLPQDEPPSQ